jgi:protein gp37
MNLDGFLTYEYPHCAGFRGGHVEEGYCTNCHGHITDPIHTQSPAKLDWIVAGGESGPGARPMHPDWARSLRDQCATAGVPFYFKQWGEWDGGLNAIPQDCQTPCGRCVMALRTWNGNEWRGEKLTDTNWTPGVQPGALQIHRVGKKAAGHLLDGREHREFPNAS